MSNTNNAISSNIKKSLLDSLYRAREKIEENKDIYIRDLINDVYIYSRTSYLSISLMKIQVEPSIVDDR